MNKAKTKFYLTHAELDNRSNAEDGLEIITDCLSNTDEAGVIKRDNLDWLASSVQEYRHEPVNDEIDSERKQRKERGVFWDYLSVDEEDELRRKLYAKFDDAPVYEVEIKVRKVGRVDKEGKFNSEKSD